MTKKGDYNIGEIYQGGYSSLDPNKSYINDFTGYRSTTGSLALTTDPRSANIIKEVSSKLSSGVKNVELALVSPELFDSIPKQHFKEVKQLKEVTGIDVSVHGPVIDTSGITQQGFNELNRENSEKKIAEYLKRSHEVNPKGNVPVVFHSAEGIPGSQWKQIPDKTKDIKGEAKQLIAINKESGQMIPLNIDKKYYPGTEDLEKGTPYSAERNLEIANHSDWDNKISQLFFNKERADEIYGQNGTMIQHLLESLEKGELDPKRLNPTQQRVWQRFQDAQGYLKEVHKQADNYFSKAYEFGNPKQRKELEELNKQYKEDLEKNKKSFMGQSQAMHTLLSSLQKSELAPEMYVPIEKFAVDQSSKTFGNAAFEAFKEFKDPNKTPVTVIENPPAGMGLSTGEDLRNLVKESRKKFIERATSEGIEEKQAKQTAEKLIGATWDVGHINMLRGKGMGEKEILQETEKIAPYIKHVHLSDNFGLDHTELPMGMGNVPMKEIMERLGEKGFEAKKIIEAGNWWQHFQTPPVKETLEGLGSPMYSEGVGPYWNQSLGFQQGYLGGYGMMLPDMHYQQFGAGFSQLPQELGGQLQQGRGRMSGTPME